MKAVFFTLEPLLAEDKGPKGSPAEIMEAFRELWAQGFFTALVGARPGERRSPEMERLQTLLEQGGGASPFSSAFTGPMSDATAGPPGRASSSTPQPATGSDWMSPTSSATTSTMYPWRTSLDVAPS